MTTNARREIAARKQRPQTVDQSDSALAAVAQQQAQFFQSQRGNRFVFARSMTSSPRPLITARIIQRLKPLCLPQIKPEHIGDAVHPGSDGTECAPLPRRHVISARPCMIQPSIHKRDIESSRMVVCGALFDMRDLAQMLAHVHDAPMDVGEGPETPAIGGAPTQ